MCRQAGRARGKWPQSFKMELGTSGGQPWVWTGAEQETSGRQPGGWTGVEQKTLGRRPWGHVRVGDLRRTRKSHSEGQPGLRRPRQDCSGIWLPGRQVSR